MDTSSFNRLHAPRSNAHTKRIGKLKVGDWVRSTIDPKIMGKIESVDNIGRTELKGRDGTFGLSSLEKAHR